MWNLSTYDCECDEAYLDIISCPCKERIFDKLILTCEDEVLNKLKIRLIISFDKKSNN